MKLNEINTKILRFTNQIQADEETVKILYDVDSSEQHINSLQMVECLSPLSTRKHILSLRSVEAEIETEETSLKV